MLVREAQTTVHDSQTALFDPLLDRTRDFAAAGARDGITIAGRFPVWVLTCVDPRTDPSALLELVPGDATVFRNAGGRITPDLLRELALVSYLSEHPVKPGRPAEFEIVVIHHNQCGTRFLADHDFRGVAKRLGGGSDAFLASLEAKQSPLTWLSLDERARICCQRDGRGLGDPGWCLPPGEDHLFELYVVSVVLATEPTYSSSILGILR